GRDGLVERERRLAAAALQGARRLRGVAREVAEEALHVVAEAAAARLEAREHVRLEEPGEEVLRQVLRVLIASGPGGARVGADRLPVAATERLHAGSPLIGRGGLLDAGDHAPRRVGEARHARPRPWNGMLPRDF